MTNWCVEFTVDDETDDIEGQLNTVSLLCQQLGIACAEYFTVEHHCLLLTPPIDEDKVDKLVIEATRKHCKVKVTGQRPRDLNAWDISAHQ